jgi:hypothetical protein
MKVERGAEALRSVAGGRGVRLLDVDPDLGSALSDQELADARDHAVLPAVGLEPRPWSVKQLRGSGRARGELHGFMVIDGVLSTDAWLGGRRCVRVITEREIMLLDRSGDTSLPVGWGWSTLTAARVAILDDRLLLIAVRWPRLFSAILKRAAAQERQALLQQAISQLPRVEDRLLALFWALADRRGSVRSDGILVGLTITHQSLAEMIGAQRPTVSLGLARLLELGWLRSTADGWLIDPASRNHFPRPDQATSGTVT